MLNFLQTEAELAALLAHEIAHVDLRHCIERFQYELQLRKVAPGGVAALAQIAYRLLTVGYSKQQEHEADVLSVVLAARAGYHPKHVLSFDDRIRDLQNMRSGARRPPRFMVEEVIRAVLTGLSDYVVTHPDPGDRIVEVYATLRKNQRDWEGERFYVGRSNHADRLSRRSEERSFEIAAYDEPPLLGAYLADRRYAPFKAFAAHVRSGLSAIAAHEATPAAATATALRDCEQKMQPCLLYALGDRIVLGMTGEEIEAEKARYRDDVCRTPPAVPVEGCVRVSPAPDRPAEPPAGLRPRRRR